MGKTIIKIKDKYFEWSSIVDAPTSYGLSLEEFKNYYKERYGSYGFETLETDLLRVEKTGTSSRFSTLDCIIAGNRAGDDEEELTIDEIYEKYSV